MAHLASIAGELAGELVSNPNPTIGLLFFFVRVRTLILCGRGLKELTLGLCELTIVLRKITLDFI